MDEQTLQFLVLGCLIHDIGKTAQRAGRPSSRDQESTYCPTDSRTQRPTHTHVLYTDYFIENDLKLPNELSGRQSHLARLASAHHRPDESSLMEMALSVADRLSAGTDRAREQEVDAGDYKKARLLSIMQYIDPAGAEAQLEAEHQYYRLAALPDDPFPTSLDAARQTGYAELFDAFLQDIDKLPTQMGVPHYIASLQSLLEKHMWCVPSSTYRTDPDISLYDHALTTAAIAQALAVYHEEQGGMPGNNRASESKLLLFGGDLSGIQRYIFGIEKSHGAGVAKILRARSFLLQAITRSIVNSLLDRLGLLAQARIMDAGGRFLLLLPSTEKVHSMLPGFEAEVQRWFLDAFQAEVTMPLAYSTTLCESDLSMERFQDKLNAFHAELERKKLCRFQALTGESLSPVFSMDYSAYSEGACHVCNVHPVDTESRQSFLQEYGRDIAICSRCFEQIAYIGKRLPNRKYIVFSRRTGQGGLLLFDNISLRLLSEVEEKHMDALEIVNYRDFDSFAHHAVAGHLPLYRQEDIQDLDRQGELTREEDGEYWWGDEERVEEGAPKTLNMLAFKSRVFDREASQLRGKAMLGAFKADVDNLGLIFGLGLKDKLSISRFSFLSRMFNHFFADYVVSHIQEQFPDIYAVFAGGDDVFFLGPWNQVADMASFIAQHFRTYVAGNPRITLSAGITVHKPGEPIHTIADLAEKELEKSKRRKVKGQEVKNGVTLFGVTTDWERFEQLLDKGRWIEGLILDNKMTLGLARRLMSYTDAHRRFMDGHIKAGMYKSHMEYDFSRNVYDHLRDKAESDSISANLRSEDALQDLRLPLSWALYHLRSE